MKFFSSNPGEIKDMSELNSADIFNQSIAPIFAELDANTERLRGESAQRDEANLFRVNEAENLVSSILSQRRQLTNDVVAEDYNSPLPTTTSTAPMSTTPNTPVVGGKELLKLSNYGYASDSSPDTNSNILKIGHANNPLKDGVSAALTKSLAKRYGLKTGDMFEVTTADGTTMVRRYDDTVPNVYRGKKLPETVDLYEIGGNNNFSGKVVALRPLKK